MEKTPEVAGFEESGSVGRGLGRLRQKIRSTRTRVVEDSLGNGRVQEIDVNLNLAKVALSLGNFDVAQEHANHILQSVPSQDKSAVSAKLILLQIKSRQGLFKGLLDDLENLFKENPHINPELQANIGNEIIRVCHRSENLGIGALRGEEMVRDFAATWPETEVVELLCQLASCHFRRGDIERAEEIVARALELAEKCKAPKAMTQSYWQRSILAENRGDLSLALDYATNAKHWAQLAELHQVLPILNDNAAKWMLDLPNPDLKHIHDLAESAYLELSSQNSPGIASYTCITLSEVALRQEDYLNALMYVRKGLSELPPEIPGPKASLYVQEAKVLARMGNYEESKFQLIRAIERLTEMDPTKELAKHWGDVARIFVEVGMTDRGVYAYEQALQIAGICREEQDIPIR